MVSAESQAAIEAARNAVREFMARNGHSDTTVHERVAPAVYHQTIARKEHEELETAVDREQHYNHYHTSVQPIYDSETTEEQHHSNLLPVENRTFEHDDREEVQRRIDAEHAKFKDHVQHLEGEHTQVVHPQVTAEQ